MILTKTPLRISFVGGGSDRPSFYQEEPGACVAAAIDKYVYVAVNDHYDGTIRAAYSTTENVANVDEVQHELIRECLKHTGRLSGVEVHSIADVPGGSGLGSSSAFTVGLLAALDPYGEHLWAANIASQIEIEACAKSIGKQDQYTAAYGGVNLLSFTRQGVTVDPIPYNVDAPSAHCLLLDTGLARVGDAGAVLAAQRQDRDDVRQLANYAYSFASALQTSNWIACGRVMHLAWEIKRKFIDSLWLDVKYEAALAAGAWGGKLCGAGGGGFLLFLAPPEKHAGIVQALGLRHVPIKVGVGGCCVVYHS